MHTKINTQVRKSTETVRNIEDDESVVDRLIDNRHANATGIEKKEKKLIVVNK